MKNKKLKKKIKHLESRVKKLEKPPKIREVGFHVERQYNEYEEE